MKMRYLFVLLIGLLFLMNPASSFTVDNITITRTITQTTVAPGGYVNVSLQFISNEDFTFVIEDKTGTTNTWDWSPVWTAAAPADNPSQNKYYINRTTFEFATSSAATKGFFTGDVKTATVPYECKYFLKVPAVAPGPYTITGNISANSTQKVILGDTTVTVTGIPPVPAFNPVPTSGTVPLSVTFTDNSLTSILWWNWSFGDGQWLNTTVGGNPVHQYNAVGTWNARLTVTNASGNATSAPTVITVSAGPLPVAAFNPVPTSGNVPLSVTFTDQSQTSITIWNWSFGDGQWFNTTVGGNPVHQYNAVGPYNARLTVSNVSGNTTSAPTAITVNAGPVPIANFVATSPTSGNAPWTVNFDASSSSVVSPLNYTWCFGDNTGQHNLTVTPSRQFTNPGTYTVTLWVRNASGYSDPFARTDYVVVAQQAAPTIPNNTGTGNNVNINLTGSAGNMTLTPGSSLVVTNVSGFGQVTLFGNLTVNATTGNIEGTVTSTQLTLNPVNATVGGQDIAILGGTITTTGYNATPFTFTFNTSTTGTDTTYLANLESGTTGMNTLAIIGITTSATVQTATIKMSVPYSWYANYSSPYNSRTAGNPYAVVMWTHGTDAPLPLSPTWGTDYYDTNGDHMIYLTETTTT